MTVIFPAGPRAGCHESKGNDLVGAAAVDTLVSLVHRNERSILAHLRATLIGSHWVNGGTIKHAAAGG